jgi:hypothetical protein
MKPKDRIIKVLNREQPDRIPTFEWFIDRTVGKALTGSEDPIEIVEKLDLDGINIRADYQKEPIVDDTHKDEWGIIRKDTGDCIAAVMESPISDITLHKEYQFPDPLASHRFDTLRQAIEQFGWKDLFERQHQLHGRPGERKARRCRGRSKKMSARRRQAFYSFLQQHHPSWRQTGKLRCHAGNPEKIRLIVSS